MELHGIELSDEELELIENIGTGNLDYAICEIYKRRNPKATVVYDEDSGELKTKSKETEVSHSIQTILETPETEDAIEKVAVAVSMLEVSSSMWPKWT